MNIIEHSQTLLNIYFQGLQPTIEEREQGMTKPIVSTSRDDGNKVQTRKASTRPDRHPMKKLYKCTKCSHPPFQNKYSLAQHISVKREAQGSQCDICLEMMSPQHLADHRDKHSVNDRYICKEKLPTGQTCSKNYKRKLGIARHLKIAHRGKSFGSAKLEIIDRKDLKYITKEEYTQEHQVMRQ